MDKQTTTISFIPPVNDKWNKLSLRDKAAMMEVAVRNGITNLAEIRQKYNKFAMGGITDGEPEGVNTPVLPAISVYIQPTDNTRVVSNEMVLAYKKPEPQPVVPIAEEIPAALQMIRQIKANDEKIRTHKRIESHKHIIPYDRSKEINLTTGRSNTMRISTNMLDSIFAARDIYNASKEGQANPLTIEEALGLPFRETTFGLAKRFPINEGDNMKKRTPIAATDLISNWQQIDPGVLPNSYWTKYNDIVTKWNEDPNSLSEEDIAFLTKFQTLTDHEVETLRPLKENALVNGFRFFKTGQYGGTRGDKGHTNLVREEGAQMMTDPAIAKYIEENNIHSIGGPIVERANRFAEGGPTKKPKYQYSEQAYYDPDTDTVYAPDSTGEFYQHEMFHARPDTTLLQKLRPYYEELNDDKLKQMGADIPFIMRVSNDPNHFYSPEELGARIKASKFMLAKQGVKNIDKDFLQKARQDEMKYGHNFRDLLHMYNDENLLNIFNNNGDVRENNWTMQDEAGYRAWRESLPANLRDTDDLDYDIRGAYKAGLQPTLEDDGYYHLGSRDPYTGRILKAPWHPTYSQAIWTDAAQGYYPVYINGETYTSKHPWTEQGPIVERANKFDEGGTKDMSDSRHAWYFDFVKRTGRKPTWYDNFKRNLYNLVNPADGYPNTVFELLIEKPVQAVTAAFMPDTPKIRRGNNIEPVSEAAWAKRLGMPYDESLVVDNGDGTYRLPAKYEAEIPTDTTFLKNRIAANKKLANSPDVVGKQWQTLNKYIEQDQNTLDALRHTYKTGEPVVLNEYSHNLRTATTEPTTTPLNVLQNFTVQYNKDNNTMDYSDIYDFNWFEPFVPGKSYKIKGSVPLKKSLGGPIVERANRYRI